MGDMDFGFEFIHDEEDVMMRMKNDSGKELTFVTAPASAFESSDELGPIITGWGDQIIVAFNKDRIEEMIDDSIEKNAEIYGEATAAFLPVSLVLRKGMEAAEKYLQNDI